MKEYKVVIKGEDDEGNTVSRATYDSDFTAQDFAVVLWCIIDDVMKASGKSLNEIFEILKDYF